MAFHVPEDCRWLDAPQHYASTGADGNNGAFRPESCEPGWTLAIIASDGGGWEHVSVHAWQARGRKIQQRTPTWREMAQVKRLFWDDEDVVVQYYPRETDYVNLHPYTLHWWRPIGATLPTPPPSMVGYRVGDRVCFHHQDTVYRITAVSPVDGMLEIEGMSGFFASSLFRDSDPGRDPNR